MTNAVKLLTDDEVAEIEKHYEISIDSMFARSHIPALCATVRGLRSRTAYDWADIIEKLQDENTALREQLVQIQQCDKCDLCEDHHEPQR